EVLWGDEAILLTRFRHGSRDTFDEASNWLPKALVDHVQGGNAVLSVYANDPDLLKGESPELVSAVQQATSRAVRPFREYISRNGTNWTVVAAAGSAWASRVFGDLPPDARVPRLWETIARFCRLDQPDPVDAWNKHIDALSRRSEQLNAKR